MSSNSNVYHRNIYQPFITNILKLCVSSVLNFMHNLKIQKPSDTFTIVKCLSFGETKDIDSLIHRKSGGHETFMLCFASSLILSSSLKKHSRRAYRSCFAFASYKLV